MCLIQFRFRSPNARTGSKLPAANRVARSSSTRASGGISGGGEKRPLCFEQAANTVTAVKTRHDFKNDVIPLPKNMKKPPILGGGWPCLSKGFISQQAPKACQQRFYWPRNKFKALPALNHLICSALKVCFKSATSVLPSACFISNLRFFP